MTVKDFERAYGSNRAIAALAVLVEDEISGKKRVIHDGTHGVGVNNRIRCLDKVRMPGPREKKEIMQGLEAEKMVVMALVGDFEKAHRRFLYQESERGFLGCKVEDEEDLVYVNKVGTFGVGSTPYWWARLSAAVMRLTHFVLGPDFWVELLLYADDLEVIAPRWLSPSWLHWGRRSSGASREVDGPQNGLGSTLTTGQWRWVFQKGGRPGYAAGWLL